MDSLPPQVISLAVFLAYPLGAWLVVVVVNAVAHGRLLALLDSKGASDGKAVVQGLQKPLSGLVVMAAAAIGWGGYMASMTPPEADPAAWAGIVDKAIYTVAAFFAAKVLVSLVEFFLAAVMEPLAARTEGKIDDQIVKILRSTAGFLVWMVVGVSVAGKFGVNIASLVAGLGIGGIAFAMAAKDTLSQAFGGIVLLMDKPFEVGDNIEVAGVAGTVEEIGLRSTRIRGFDRTMVTIPNANIAADKIINFSRRNGFRQITTLGLLYDTPPEKIQKAKETLERIIEEHSQTLNDTWVNFTDYGASSLDLEVIYWIDVRSGADLRKVRHEVNLTILEQFTALGVGFAFPTTTLEWASGQKPGS